MHGVEDKNNRDMQEIKEKNRSGNKRKYILLGGIIGCILLSIYCAVIYSDIKSSDVTVAGKIDGVYRGSNAIPGKSKKQDVTISSENNDNTAMPSNNGYQKEQRSGKGGVVGWISDIFGGKDNENESNKAYSHDFSEDNGVSTNRYYFDDDDEEENDLDEEDDMEYGSDKDTNDIDEDDSDDNDSDEDDSDEDDSDEDDSDEDDSDEDNPYEDSEDYSNEKKDVSQNMNNITRKEEDNYSEDKDEDENENATQDFRREHIEENAENDDVWESEVDKIDIVDNTDEKVEETNNTSDNTLDSSEEENDKTAEDKVPISIDSNSSSIIQGIESDYVIKDSDTRYITTIDIEKLNENECNIARLEIYARYGVIFNDDGLQQQFTKKSWYKRMVEAEDFDVTEFNEYEAANLKFIEDYCASKGYKIIDILEEESKWIV